MARRKTAWLAGVVGLLCAAGSLGVIAVRRHSAQSVADTPSGVAKGSMFLPFQSPTRNPSIAFDPKGVMHAAYSASAPDMTGLWPVYYAECASDCTQRGSWHNALIGDVGPFGGTVTLKLDPQGHPRVMWYRQAEITKDGMLVYASCDRECGNRQSWSSVPLVKTSSEESSYRYFALDRMGMPRFVYQATERSHARAAIYAWCDNDCSSEANWHHLPFQDGSSDELSLACDSAGNVHLASVAKAPTGATVLRYSRCESPCTERAHWRVTSLLSSKAMGQHKIVLQLDLSGHPHLAFSSRKGAEGAIYYLHCQSGCTEAANWKMQTVESLGSGEILGDGPRPDLTIDSRGIPHLAYQVLDAMGTTLRYRACVRDCDSDGSSWRTLAVETSAAVDAGNKIPLKGECTRERWLVGANPSLALDGQDRVHVAYETRHEQGGGCKSYVDVELVRYSALGALAE